MTTWILILSVSLYGVSVPVTSIFQCSPITAFWDKSIEHATCLDITTFVWTIGSLNLILDVAIVTLPVYVLKDLRVPRMQKWVIIGMFAIAAL